MWVLSFRQSEISIQPVRVKASPYSAREGKRIWLQSPLLRVVGFSRNIFSIEFKRLFLSREGVFELILSLSHFETFQSTHLKGLNLVSVSDFITKPHKIIMLT